MPKLSDALIGYTGLVGGNLLPQHQFEHLYNSKNIEEIQNKDFDLAVCAGAPSLKWLANKEPDRDLANIERLIINLKKIKAQKFILISTIDVYASVDGVDEDTVITPECLSPYGKHRQTLEEFAVNNFDTLIVRLPAVFGRGLKKNALYDLMHGDFKYINPESILQFYNLDYLWADIGKALENNLKILNLATEPVKLGIITKEIFNLDLAGHRRGGAPPHGGGKTETNPVFYDMRTKHAGLWGNTKPYLYLKEEVLKDIKLFAAEH